MGPLGATAPSASAVAGPKAVSVRAPVPTDTKTACIYSHHSITALQQFGRLVGRDFTCALVYNNASPDWQGWESPWFTHQTMADSNWAAWATAVPGRRLVVSQAMRPGQAPSDWVYEGAAGAFDNHALALARNLVRAGLGSSIIRLGFEANGTGTVDSLGSTQKDWAKWRTYWARIASVMRSVPGERFEFDWTVNAGYRPIPLSAYYPGNSVVDVIGIDAYDSSPAHRAYPSPDARWAALSSEPSGVNELAAFAKAHTKPLSLPEWGVVQTGTSWGAGDDPRYVDGIAEIVRTNPVRYQSYFLNTTGNTILISNAPQSLERYRFHFGQNGDAVG